MRSRLPLRHLISIVSALLIVLWFADALPWRDRGPAQDPIVPKQRPPEKHLVVAKIRSEDVSWIARRLPGWSASIYVADNPNATLTVPLNKGREGMTYLTYIIDHYDALPEIMLFIHGAQYQWHNDDSNKDSATVISRLQLPYLRARGYVNLRCVWTLGCPAEIPHPARPTTDQPTQQHYADAFVELFPGRELPDSVGVSCCAQFGVTAAMVRRHPKETYARWRQWLLDTPLEDATSGRIMEYSWHMLFDQEPVFCPNARSCYCNVFGICDLTGCSDGECQGMYTLPTSSLMPEGWKPLPEYENVTAIP